MNLVFFFIVTCTIMNMVVTEDECLDNVCLKTATQVLKYNLNLCTTNNFLPKEIRTPNSYNFIFNPLMKLGTLHFSVKAPRSAQIALTATDNNIGEIKGGTIYEVCLGSENNTKTSIYKNHIIRITVNTPQILNGDKTRGFWINWCGGFIGVGKRGEQNPFISWLDKDSLNVSFYGVRTRDNATGVWTIKGPWFDTLQNWYEGNQILKIH